MIDRVCVEIVKNQLSKKVTLYMYITHVESDPWIVVPPGQPLCKSHLFKKIKSMSTLTIGCINTNGFSHNINQRY